MHFEPCITSVSAPAAARIADHCRLCAGNSGEIPKIPDNLSDGCKAVLKRMLTRYRLAVFANRTPRHREPAQRPDASELLRDPWLQDVVDQYQRH